MTERLGHDPHSNSAAPSPSDVEFPSYPEWLAQHQDEDIAALLWRLYAQGSTSLLEQLSGQAHPEPALQHLTSLELATLHAAVEIGAATFPTPLTDLVETLTELFDIAGTPPEQRPTEAQISQAVRRLASWGLLFSPDLHLSDLHLSDPHLSHTTPSNSNTLPGAFLFKVPAHLPPLFEPSTEHLWRLADCNRCPIPTPDLPEQVDALPPRQRRLLGTLSAAGGVGHSASLQPDSKPDAPLPTMVRHGILDQLDDTTARLSGRVSAYLRRTLIAPPGGVFVPFPSSPDATSERTDATGVATAVQTIQELTEAITDLGAHPIQPLGSGGVGARELNKASRRRNISPDHILAQITDLHLANFLAREFPEPTPPEDTGKTYWAVTELALDFAESPLSTQWALLLLGWAGSTYCSWETRDPDVRALSPELYSFHAHELRRYFGAAFLSGDPVAYLWQRRPSLAWSTPQLAWDVLVDEALRLGLLAPASPSLSSSAPQPTSALQALDGVLTQVGHAMSAGEPLSLSDAVTDLSLRLESVLPDPVSMLIVQGDHTILAPGLLAAEDHRMLARMAVAESTGMASVWRVSKNSLIRALELGESPQSLEAFLDRMSPGGLSSVPQSLRYLIDDATRAFQQGSATEPHSARVPSRVDTPQRHIMDITGDSTEIASEIDGAVEGFRRAHDQAIAVDPADGTKASDTRTFRSPREIMSELRRAYTAGTQVRLHYVDYAGATSHDWISIVMMTPSTISAVLESTGESLTIQPHRIAAVDVPC